MLRIHIFGKKNATLLLSYRMLQRAEPLLWSLLFLLSMHSRVTNNYFSIRVMQV